MRYIDLLKEDIDTDLKNDITNILVNIQSQGVNKITIPQILDILRNKIEYNGLSIDSNIVNDTLEKIDNVTVKPDMENNGILTVEINSPSSLPQTNKQNSQDKVDNMAQKTIKNSLKGD